MARFSQMSTLSGGNKANWHTGYSGTRNECKAIAGYVNHIPKKSMIGEAQTGQCRPVSSTQGYVPQKRSGAHPPPRIAAPYVDTRKPLARCGTPVVKQGHAAWGRETSLRSRCATLTRTCIWGRCARPPMRWGTDDGRRGSGAPLDRCPRRIRVSCFSS